MSQLYGRAVAVAVLFACAITVARPPRIAGGGSVITALREADPSSTASWRFEVFADTLEAVPIVFQVSFGLALDPSGMRASIERNGVRWYEHVLPTVVKDGVETVEYRLDMLQDSERIEWNQFSEHGPRGFSRNVPNVLRPGEAVYTLWKLVGPDGNRLPAGMYDVSFAAQPGVSVSEFFGIEGGVGGNAQILVKEHNGSDEDRYHEDLIERHYLWAGWLYKFDRTQSKKEYQKAWELVQGYLRKPTPGPAPEYVLRRANGVVLMAGDEPGLWNITPRYQAAAIAGKLDYHKEAIAYLSQLLSKDATERANGRDCKMRFYHFHRERGHLPRNMRDDLARGLNRAYEQFYGKTMQGAPVERLPIRKNFTEKSRAPGDK